MENAEDVKDQLDWEKTQEQVEDLNVRVARYFEDANDSDKWRPPMVASPLQPTK